MTREDLVEWVRHALLEDVDAVAESVLAGLLAGDVKTLSTTKNSYQRVYVNAEVSLVISGEDVDWIKETVT